VSNTNNSVTAQLTKLNVKETINVSQMIQPICVKLLLTILVLMLVTHSNVVMNNAELLKMTVHLNLSAHHNILYAQI
jgi:glycerol uptake facilitator-like aquaporin